MFTTHIPSLLVILTYLVIDIALFRIITTVYAEKMGCICHHRALVMSFVLLFSSLGYFRLVALYYKGGFIINSTTHAILVLSPEIFVIFLMIAPYLLKKASLIPSVLNKNELIRWIIK